MKSLMSKLQVKIMLIGTMLIGLIPTSTFAGDWNPAEETQKLLEEAQSQPAIEPPSQFVKIALGVVTLVRWGGLGLGLIFFVKVLLALYKGMYLEGREFKQVKRDLGKDFILLNVGFSLFAVISLIFQFIG